MALTDEQREAIDEAVHRALEAGATPEEVRAEFEYVLEIAADA